MTTREKRIEKILNKKEVSFTEIHSILHSTGYRLTRIKGSHHIFKHANGNILVFPVHDNLIKRCYIKEIIKKINHANNEEMSL